MAHIAYVDEDRIPERDRVNDRDHIIRIHGVNSPVMRHHHALYVAVMHRASPLSRMQREMIAVAVSAHNGCHY